MRLQTQKRTAGKKSEINRMRREGHIPAVIYSKEKGTEAIAIPNVEMQAHLRQIQSGRLPTSVFTLKDHDKDRKVVIKEIQYHPTTYDILHIDFEELHDKVKVNVNVPIECTGVVDCVGIKLGGTLRQVIRNLRVRCLPKDIPSVFELDIKNMALFESKKLSDLAIPNTVRPLGDLNEVVAVIVKR